MHMFSCSCAFGLSDVQQTKEDSLVDTALVQRDLEVFFFFDKTRSSSGKENQSQA